MANDFTSEASRTKELKEIIALELREIKTMLDQDSFYKNSYWSAGTNAKFERVSMNLRTHLIELSKIAKGERDA